MTINSAVKKRDVSIDIARAIAIILVVSGHCVEKLADPVLASTLKSLIYIGHLPLFFMISGYLYKSGKSFGEMIQKLFRSILIPYMCCAGILFLYTAVSEGIAAMISGGAYNWQALTTMLIGFITQKRYGTIWFLPVLFFCELFYWCIDTSVKKDSWKYVICVLLGIAFIVYDNDLAPVGNYNLWFPDAVLANPLPWNLDAAFISLIFFGFGNLLKKQDVFSKYFASKERVIGYGVLFFAAAIVLFLISFLNGYPTIEMWNGCYGIFPLTISSALLMAMSIMLLSRLLVKSKLLPFIGQNTFVIFAFHQMIGLDLARKVIDFYGINVPTASGAVFTLLIMYTGIILCSLIFGYGLHHLHLDFVVGKKTKKQIRTECYAAA